MEELGVDDDDNVGSSGPIVVGGGGEVDCWMAKAQRSRGQLITMVVMAHVILIGRYI